MVVGVATVEIYLAENGSLKGKRQVVQSVKERVKQRFNVSIAEVGNQELWQRAVLGIACVGTDGRFVSEVLDKAVGVIRSNPELEVLRSEIDLR